jgi:polysaccharide export outer membrane protein
MTLIDPIRSNAIGGTDASQSNMQIMNTTFVVNNEGIVELPIVGKKKVDGYNEEELRQILKKEFDNIYNNPFLYLKVENRRAIVFKGTEGMIIPLNRTPTNIFEVLAKSGGIDRHMKSYDIQLIRGNLKNPDVYKVDLSTLQGIQNSELLVQSNDIIYVQERRRPVFYAMSDVAPIVTVPLSIISSITTTILLFITINK